MRCVDGRDLKIGTAFLKGASDTRSQQPILCPP